MNGWILSIQRSGCDIILIRVRVYCSPCWKGPVYSHQLGIPTVALSAGKQFTNNIAPYYLPNVLQDNQKVYLPN